MGDDGFPWPWGYPKLVVYNGTTGGTPHDFGNPLRCDFRRNPWNSLKKSDVTCFTLSSVSPSVAFWIRAAILGVPFRCTFSTSYADLLGIGAAQGHELLRNNRKTKPWASAFLYNPFYALWGSVSFHICIREANTQRYQKHLVGYNPSNYIDLIISPTLLGSMVVKLPVRKQKHWPVWACFLPAMLSARTLPALWHSDWVLESIDRIRK